MDEVEDRNQEMESSGEPGLKIRLDVFEGPLDMLLHMITREEIDLWNIPIARVTEQYLSYLSLMRDLNINLAGEWLVMAATLIQIKSRMLLPPDPTGAPQEESKEDPRNELVYQLLEHQKFKNAAQMLHSREEVENAVWHKPPKEVLSDDEEVISVTLFDLVKAFQEILLRFESRHSVELDQEEVSMEQALLEIRQALLVREKMLFSSLFLQARSKRHLIALFLAILELTRLKEVWVYQKRAFDEIQITRNSGAQVQTV